MTTPLPECSQCHKAIGHITTFSINGEHFEDQLTRLYEMDRQLFCDDCYEGYLGYHQISYAERPAFLRWEWDDKKGAIRFQSDGERIAELETENAYLREQMDMLRRLGNAGLLAGIAEGWGDPIMDVYDEDELPIELRPGARDSSEIIDEDRGD